MDVQRSRKKGRANYYVVVQVSSSEILKGLREVQMHLESSYPTVRSELRKGFTNLDTDIHLTLFALHANTTRAQQVLRYVIYWEQRVDYDVKFLILIFAIFSERSRNLNSQRQMILVSSSSLKVSEAGLPLQEISYYTLSFQRNPQGGFFEILSLS
jgi:hypothetical protein